MGTNTNSPNNNRNDITYISQYFIVTSTIYHMKKATVLHRTETRKQKIEVRMSIIEKQLLTAKVKSAGLNISDWLRTILREDRIVAIMSPSDIRHFKTLCTISNDLTTLVRLAEIVGLPGLENKSLILIEQINQIITQIFNNDHKNRSRT
jgi:hypothetical protein